MTEPIEPLPNVPGPPPPEPVPVEPQPGAVTAPVSSPPSPELAAPLLEQGERPTYVFFGIVAAVSLAADVMSKAWAEIVLSQRTALDPSIVILKNHLTLTLAYNKGGAWGLLQNASETVRRPFFLLVSVLAIAFIVSLYGRLAPGQRALKWGLPLVLGGALGNLSDRITRSSVIDFIDYRADWIQSMNGLVARWFRTWSVTDHWPTFNVADISICIGVGLMAVDMITSRRRVAPGEPPPPAPADAPREAAGSGLAGG
jgi:signal peptidase II